MPAYDYECPQSHTFELSRMIKDRDEVALCPKCNKRASRIFSFRSTEPSFTDKLYPFWDTAVNKIFHSPSERKSYLKANGYVVKDNGHMTKDQEAYMYRHRLGNFDPREARHANK